MKKPSRKVISIMILLGAFTVAMISADALEKSALDRKNNPDSTVKAVKVSKTTTSKSLEDFFVSQMESDSNQDNAPKTLTDFVLKELFDNYHNLKDRNLNTPENLDALTTKLANETKEMTNLPVRYSAYDIETFPDYDKDKMKNYGNQFAQLTEVYFKEKFELERIDSMKYVQDYSDLQINYANALSQIEVPRSISDEHLEFTNNLVKIGVALVKLAEIEEDPVLSGFILNQYDEIRSVQPKILVKISETLKLNGIIFTSEDPGVMWNNF